MHRRFVYFCLWLVQVQYSLLDRRPENGMIDYCALHDIQLLPYGTVAGGFLSDRYLGLPASKCVPCSPSSLVQSQGYAERGQTRVHTVLPGGVFLSGSNSFAQLF